MLNDPPPRSSSTTYLGVPEGPPQKYARPKFQKSKINSGKRKIGLRLIVPDLWHFYLQKIFSDHTGWQRGESYIKNYIYG